MTAIYSIPENVLYSVLKDARSKFSKQFSIGRPHRMNASSAGQRYKLLSEYTDEVNMN